MAALRRKGQAALEEDAFVMRIIRLESVVGNPLPKSLTCHAADLEGCKRWVEALQAEAIGEEVSMAKAAGSKAAAAKDAAKGKAAATVGASRNGARAAEAVESLIGTNVRASRLRPHRVLAINRAEEAKELRERAKAGKMETMPRV